MANTTNGAQIYMSLFNEEDDYGCNIIRKYLTDQDVKDILDQIDDVDEENKKILVSEKSITLLKDQDDSVLYNIVKEYESMMNWIDTVNSTKHGLICEVSSNKIKLIKDLGFVLPAKFKEYESYAEVFSSDDTKLCIMSIEDYIKLGGNTTNLISSKKIDDLDEFCDFDPVTKIMYLKKEYIK